MATGTQADDLERTFGRAGAISFTASVLGGAVAHLAAQCGSATIALQGAQVLSWRHRGVEQLWLSPVARLGDVRPVRGGVPVCWPWFGAHPEDTTKPSHGFVRTLAWQVAATTHASSPEHASITLTFETRPAHAGLWPHSARAELTVRLDDGLSLKLETTNTGAAPLVLSEALHTYFAVSDIGDVVIRGLENVDFIDTLDGHAIKRHGEPITIDAEIDRIYVGDTRAITLSDQTRRIAIAAKGSASAVVWNPWIAKTQRLGDLGGPDAYRRMMCVETTNAGSDQILLGPGQRHTLEVRYDVA